MVRVVGLWAMWPIARYYQVILVGLGWFGQAEKGVRFTRVMFAAEIGRARPGIQDDPDRGPFMDQPVTADTMMDVHDGLQDGVAEILPSEPGDAARRIVLIAFDPSHLSCFHDVRPFCTLVPAGCLQAGMHSQGFSHHLAVGSPIGGLME